MTEPVVKTLTPDDLREITRIHCAAFPRSALTKLGWEAVRRYYNWLLTGPHQSENLGAWSDGRLVGFCFGGIFKGALGGFLRRNRGFLAWRVLTHPWLLGNEMIRGRIGMARSILGYGPPAQPNSYTPAGERGFGILAIATDPAYQGKGVGQALMKAAEQTAREKRFKTMVLTVAVINVQAIGFYERLGWEKSPDAEGIWKGRMQKLLS